MNFATLLPAKIKAFSIHLLLSAIIISAYYLVVYFSWHPQPYFYLNKVSEVILILVAVDLVIGPALTFLVYRPEKPGLKFDLSVIAFIQIIALSWGVHITYIERPLYAVFVDEFFQVVSANELKDNNPDKYKEALSTERPGLIYLDVPHDIRIDPEKHRKSIFMPEYYRPYHDYSDWVSQHGIDMDDRMKTYPALKEYVGGFLREHGGEITDYVFLPIHGKKRIGMLALHKGNMQIAGAITEEILEL